MRDFLISSGYTYWVLPLLLIIPLVGAAALFLWGAGARDDGGIEHAGSARWIALITFLAEFVVSLGLWWTYDTTATGWQNYFSVPWILPWHANITLGIDGISLFMILLTTFLMPLVVLGGWTSVRKKLRTYYALMLILTTGMLGVFMALDMLLFYVMWEVMLVPMYFIIGIWGGERRIYSSVKFFIYTMIGSLLMLVAIIYMWNATGQQTFSYDMMFTVVFPASTQLLLFTAFFLAFAVKVPMFPFHTWLPDAHVEAPTGGSVVLASIMLKMGTYGFLRFAVPFFPGIAFTPWVRGLILVLAVIGILYGALVALVQPDFKKLVAYSSVSHLGFVMLGIFAFTVHGVQGALMVMINHGISTGALFLLIGMLYERRHTHLISAFGGITSVAPLFGAFLVLVSLSSIALPGTNGFVGEFLVLLGAYETQPVLAVISATGVIFAAAYLLWAIQRVLFGKNTNPDNAHLTDLNWRELTIMGTLTVTILWLGLYPKPVLDRMQPAAERFVRLVEHPASGPTVHGRRGGPRYMSFDLSIPSHLAFALAPDLILMAGAMALLLMVVWRPESAERDRFAGRMALLICALTAAAVVFMATSEATAGPGMIAVDRFRWVVDLLILLATAITIALSMDENRRDGIVLGEGYVMVLFAAVGMMVLAAARDLVLVFLGIELMSIAVYVLAGLNRRSARAAEASLKYFLLGAFATGFLLYGIALVYGATGSTDFSTIGGMLSGSRPPSVVLLLGIAMLVVGFGFKIAAVPFHMWTPDVYEGAPTPFTAFMAAGVKTAAFASLIRLWMEAFPGIRTQWIPVIWWLAAATMIFGNLVALQQKNVKRMLAYSSIAHAGYLLVALASASVAATSTLVFYMMAYTLATMGAFAVVVAVSRPGGQGQRVSDLEGLWQSNPWLAGAMAVFMMSLLGFPIAGGMGFFAKWYVLKTALTGAVPQVSLAVILVLTSVVSAGYYLGIIVTMFMKPLAPDVPRAGPTPRLTGWVIGIAAVTLLFFGVQPGLLVRMAVESTPSSAHLQAPTAATTPVAPR